MGNPKDSKAKSHEKGESSSSDDRHNSSSRRNSDHEELRTVRAASTAAVGADVVPDWRKEMREEIRSVLAESMEGFRFAPGPTEINAADVLLESESVKDVVKRIEAQHRDNKTAIRLASITKEGNKQHFLDMVDIQGKLDIAMAAMKKPETMSVDDFHVARDSVQEASKMVTTRMDMIEKIDKHPLSWPVATEFQKLKRAKPEDDEEDKLFQQAEKKVMSERKRRDDESKTKARQSSSNRPFRAPQRFSQHFAGRVYQKIKMTF
jgi:hypothetical protein